MTGVVVRDPNLGTGGFVILPLVVIEPDLRMGMGTGTDTGIVAVVFEVGGSVLTPLDGIGALDLIVALEVEVVEVEVEANLACNG